MYHVYDDESRRQIDSREMLKEFAVEFGTNVNAEKSYRRTS